MATIRNDILGLYVWLYGCRPKSVSAGLWCSLGCAPALAVTHSAVAVAVCGLWRYVSAIPFDFLPARHNYLLVGISSFVGSGQFRSGQVRCAWVERGQA